MAKRGDGKRKIVEEWLNHNKKKIRKLKPGQVIDELVEITGLSKNTLKIYWQEWKKGVDLKNIDEEIEEEYESVAENTSIREKINILDDFDRRRIKKLMIMGNRVVGRHFNYRINKNGISVLDDKNRTLRNFKSLDEIREYEIEENLRFQNEMQEIRDIMKIKEFKNEI